MKPKSAYRETESHAETRHEYRRKAPNHSRRCKALYALLHLQFRSQPWLTDPQVWIPDRPMYTPQPWLFTNPKP